MNKFIKLPKFITHSDYELNNDKYLDYVIKKQKDRYLLFEKENFENDTSSFWFIDDIAKSVLNHYGECIFVLVSLNEDKKIDIFIGNTVDISNLNLFSYMSSDIKDLTHLKKTLDSKINFLRNTLDLEEGIVIFNVDINENILIDMFSQIKVIEDKDRFSQLLSKTKYYEKSFNQFLPFLLAIILFVVLLFISSYYINEHNSKTKELFDAEKKAITLDLESIKNDTFKLKNRISEEQNKLNQIHLISDELYKEGME